MYSIFLLIAGGIVDIIAILMKGSSLFIVWGIVRGIMGPAVEVMALTWTMAVLVIFVARFIVGKNSDIPDVAPDEFMAYIGMSLWKTFARCFSFVILAFLLGLIL